MPVPNAYVAVADDDDLHLAANDETYCGEPITREVPNSEALSSSGTVCDDCADNAAEAMVNGDV